MEFQLADLFECLCDARPEADVLVAGEKRRTRAELERRANQLAHTLQSRGVGPGDHVGIYAHNCVEFVESMLAAYKIRAVPININFRYVDNELRYLFDNADLVAIVHQRRFAPRVAAVKDEMPKLRHFMVLEDGSGEEITGLDSVDYEAALEAASPKRDFEPRSGDDIYILDTGGTTGMPKGVMWRQQDVIFALGGGVEPNERQAFGAGRVSAAARPRRGWRFVHGTRRSGRDLPSLGLGRQPVAAGRPGPAW